MALLRHHSSPRINDVCYAVTSRAHCSICDADIGTGINKKASLCLNFCDEWLMACRNEYIDHYIDPKENIPFCRDDSLICSPVFDVVSNSR
jgi:hypothetical protein